MNEYEFLKKQKEEIIQKKKNAMKSEIERILRFCIEWKGEDPVYEKQLLEESVNEIVEIGYEELS